MMQQHTLQTEQSIKIIERSVYSAKYCFIEKLSNEGIIPPPSATVMDEHFNWIVNNTNVNVDLIGISTSSNVNILEYILQGLVIPNTKSYKMLSCYF